MSTRPVRLSIAFVLVVAATWFVARPAFGVGRDRQGSDVQWHTPMKDGPWDVAADAQGVVATTSASSVYAIEPDGHVRWRSAVDELVIGQPALGTNAVLVGGEHSVTALSRSDGTRRWRTPVAGQVHSLSISGAHALVGDDTGTLTAFDSTTGVRRWSVQHPGALWSGARVVPSAGAVVATWHQSTVPAVRVFDLATGSRRWEAPTDRYTAAPVVRAGLVVLAMGDGNRHARVEARDLASGEVRWRTSVPGSFEEAIEPVADDQEVAVVDHFGVVSLLDLHTGVLRWQHDLAELVISTRVVLTAKRVSFTSHAGALITLDRRDGHLVARTMPERLGGLPVAVLAAPWRGSGRMLLALRLRDWGTQLRQLP